MITYSKALLLTALGVMFCSGCTPEQRLERRVKRLEAENFDVSVRNNDVSGLQLLYRPQREIYEVTGNTQITDAGLVHLEGLTSLQMLSLGYTQITDAGLAILKEALPNCDTGWSTAAAHP